MKVNLFGIIKQNKNVARKVLSYSEKQEADIQKYGEKKRTVALNGITEAEIDELTPFRRKSNKGNNLSNPAWFVSSYEKQCGKEFLPNYWDCFSANMKADYVVRQRYYSLLANKIMNKIQKEPIEHSYQFFDGGVVGHAVGNGTSVTYRSAHVDADVHNHPITGPLDTCKNKVIADLTESLCPKIRTAHVPHSPQDIISAVKFRKDSFVVDSNGGKFVFRPKKDIENIKERIEQSEMLDECMKPVNKEINQCSAGKFAEAFYIKNKELGYKEPIGNALKYYDEVGRIIGYPKLGEYRQKLYKSGIVDGLGKYKELN